MILEVEDIHLAFAGVKAIDGVSFTGPHQRALRHHRPQRRRQDLDLQLHLGRVPPPAGVGALRGPPAAGHAPRPHRQPGDRPHLPEHRAVPADDGARQPDARPPPPRGLRDAGRPGPGGQGQPRGGPQPRGGRGRRRVPRAAGGAQVLRVDAPLRPAEAGGAGPGAGHGSPPADARRARGRHEPRGDRGHGPLHQRHPLGAGHRDHPRGARDADGHGPGRHRACRRLRPAHRLRRPRPRSRTTPT